MFIYSSLGSGSSYLLWSFPPTATFTSFPNPGSWACAATPAFSRRLVYLQFFEGLLLPPSLALRAPCPLCYVSFCCCCLFSFFFPFSLCGGQSVQGAMVIWPRVVCGSTTCCLAHLVVCVFPSRLGPGIWQQRGSPPGFFI
jgi:hypothetical protein